MSPSEVIEETIKAIDERNPSINAFVYTNYDEARAKAREEDDKLTRGEAHGAFFGIPTAAKDFIPGIPGWPGTTGGVKALSHMIDDHWGSYTGAMNDEGAIMIGKTVIRVSGNYRVLDVRSLEYSVLGRIQVGWLLRRIGGRGRRRHPAHRRRV